MPAASAVAAVAGLLLATGPAPQVVMTLQDPSITESSGLAVSARHPGVLWTHNDGGSSAQVVAVDRRGESVARVTLAGVDPYDPEALAPGVDGKGRPLLFLGDLGDNERTRSNVSVFRFREPARLADSTVDAQWYRFTYPDGPHDAEALLVGPDGRIMIATKGLADAGLYRAPGRLVTADRGSNALVRVADVPVLVTDGAYLPDGRFVLRTYTSVYVYDRPGHEVARAELPTQPQGESVAAASARRLLVGSEGKHSQILAVPVPGPPTVRPSPTSASASPTTTPAAARDAAEPGRSGPALAIRVLGVGMIAAGAALFVRRRRRQSRTSTR